MSDQAALQERIRAFTAFYEQHAYLAYNLAVRITCAGDPAGNTVQTGFLRQIEDSPRGLVGALVEAALRETPVTPDPAAAGDSEAQTLLSAISQLAPAERAALALSDLVEADADGIGEALGLPSEQAANLLERGREGFATALGVSRADADEASRNWMWAAPPGEVWEELYPRFHRTVEGQLRNGASEHTLVLKREAATAPDTASRGAKRRLKRASVKPRRRWSRGLRWRIVVPAFALLAAVAVAAATQLGGSEATSDSPAAFDQAGGPSGPVDPEPSAPATGGDGAVAPHKPLTAALLDKLRLRELRQLRAYGRRQADKSLPARERRAATRRITAIERAARARLRAQQRRDAALRDREARQRARTQAPPPPPASSQPRPTTRTPRTQPPQNQRTTPTGPPRNRQEADQTCLMDQETGQYICPQG